MASVLSWVSDKLHDILGLSDRLTAEFLVGLARKSNSPTIFVQKLRDKGALEVNQAVEAFAHELWNKVPRNKPSEKPARALERQTILQEARNKAYTLLSDSEEDEPKVTKQKFSAKKKLEKSHRSRKNLRPQTGWNSDNEEDLPSVAKKGKNDSDDDWEQ